MTLLKDLARAKITFQARTLATILTEGKDMTDQSKPDQMSDARALVARLRKAEGSELLPKVLLGMHNTETTCLQAAAALTAALDENERLKEEINRYAAQVQSLDSECDRRHESLTAALEEIATIEREAGAAIAALLEENKRLETRIRSLDHALNFILSDAAWTPKHPACESIINRINALRKGSDQ